VHSVRLQRLATERADGVDQLVHAAQADVFGMAAQHAGRHGVRRCLLTDGTFMRARVSDGGGCRASRVGRGEGRRHQSLMWRVAWSWF
jgi:hypothetical protein